MASPVAVVGLSALMPGARDLKQFWRNIVNGVDAVSPIPPGRINGAHNLLFPEDHPAHVPLGAGGYLPEGILFDPLPYGILPKAVQQGDPDQFLVVKLAAEALADAGVGKDDPVRARTDVILGRGGYASNKMSNIYVRSEAIEHTMNALAKLAPELGPARRKELENKLYASLDEMDAEGLLTALPNAVASRASNRLDLAGASYVVDAACASSLIAVEHAVSRLRNAEADLALAGGVHFNHNPSFWYAFHHLGALSPSHRIRPFDREADGLVPGEGAGLVVLKRLEDAVRDGNRIYATIIGVGSSSDGRAGGILAPSVEGEVRALENAYHDAGVDPDTIGFVEAHGTAMPLGDASELETLRRVFGSSPAGVPTRALGSVKSMIGHCMPAAGIASLIKTVLSLSTRTLTPSLHCDEPHKALHGLPFYVPDESRPWAHGGDEPRRAGVNSFGFGGINAHTILEDARGAHTSSARVFVDALARPDELVVASAATPLALAARCAELNAALEGGASLEAVAAQAARAFDNTHDCKSAVLAGSVDALASALEGLETRLRAGETTIDLGRDVFVSLDAAQPRGKIAFIFPGLAFPGLVAGYSERLLTLCMHFPEVLEELDRIELRGKNPEDPIPTSILFAPPRGIDDGVRDEMGKRLSALTLEEEIPNEPHTHNISGACVTVSNWMSWRLLRSLGLWPDMLAGQSLGETAALAAADVFDFHDALPRFWASLDLPATYDAEGRLAFVGATQEELAELLEANPETSIAIHASRRAQLLGGPDESLARVCEGARAAGYMVHELPYPPIHTPQFLSMRDRALERVQIDIEPRPPRIPVYSSIRAEPYPSDAEGIKKIGWANLHDSVRSWQTIERMYDDGARVFLQAGGGNVAANVATILDGKPDVTIVALDADGVHPVSQLKRLCAELLCAGVALELAPLFEGRDIPGPEESPGPGAMELQFDWRPFMSLEGSEAPERETQPATEETKPAATGPEATRPGDTAPRMPFVTNVVHYAADEEIECRYCFDLDEDLYLRDHVILGAEEVKATEHCLPVVPMMVLMEVMAEVGACLAPGLGLIGFEHVRALRWVALNDVRRLEVTIRGRVLGPDHEGVRRVALSIEEDGEESARCEALYAEAYRSDVQLSFKQGLHPRSWPCSAADVYPQRYLFHGPRFQNIVELGHIDEASAHATLLVKAQDDLFASTPNPQLLLDSVTLDGAGCVVGVFALSSFLRLVMPTRMDKIELLGPRPPAGSRVLATQQVHEFDVDARRLRADFEVLDHEGYAWMRVQGYHTWIFDFTPRVGMSQRLPRQYVSSLVIPGDGEMRPDCVSLSREDLRHVNVDWIGRLVLSVDEWATFAAMNLGERWPWLMERLTIKDAVRVWWRETRGMPMPHPAALDVVREGEGLSRVRLEGALLSPLVVSCHDRNEAFACMAMQDDLEGARRALEDARKAPRPEETLDDFKPV